MLSVIDQDITGVLVVAFYYLAVVVVNIVLGFISAFPRELVRKSYHVLCSLSIFIFLELFETWYIAAVTAAALFFFSWAGTLVLRKNPWINRNFFEKIPREDQIPQQLLYAGLVLSGVLTVFWGILGSAWKIHAATGILVWGVGDASAALFGKKYGKRRLSSTFFDKDKSIEGALAFIISSFIVLFITLNYLTAWSFAAITLIAFVLAVVGSLVEAITKKGLDTLTIPLTISVLSALLMMVLN